MLAPLGLTGYGLYTLAGGIHGGLSAADIALVAGERSPRTVPTWC
jgi:hypothetical protein